MSIISKTSIIAQLESTEEFPIRLSEVWEWLGYTRKDNATRAFLALGMSEMVDYIISLRNEGNAQSGRPEDEILLTIDAFKLWCMSARTAKGKEVRLYYLQVEKEWKSLKLGRNASGITSDHIEAHLFKTAQYAPWALNNAVAADVFVGWLSDDAKKAQPEFALPSEDMQGALNGAFLNLNRSGLAMNKLFHWIDRMPTMDKYGREAMVELADSLESAEAQISKLKTDNANLKSQNKSLNDEQARLELEVSDLKISVKDSESRLNLLKREVESMRAKYKDVAMQTAVVKPGLKSKNSSKAGPTPSFLLPPAV